MSQEAGDPSGLLDQQMKGHDRVPGHKTAVHAHQDPWSLTGNVFHPFHFNSPVDIAQELEYGLSIERDVVPVHAKFIERSLGRGVGMVSVPALQDCACT